MVVLHSYGSGHVLSRRSFPRDAAVPFDAHAADRAAALYTELPRARGRDLDLAIAACALVHEAALWTLNPKDFSDVPGLRLL